MEKCYYDNHYYYYSFVVQLQTGIVVSLTAVLFFFPLRIGNSQPWKSSSQKAPITKGIESGTAGAVSDWMSWSKGISLNMNEHSLGL